MNTHNHAHARQNCSSILRYWHKVEFFIPYDLAQITDRQDAEASVRSFSIPQLQKAAQNAGGVLWKPEVPEGRVLASFDVYLGVFDKSELSRITEQVLGVGSEFERHEQEQRSELEGATCFAHIRLDMHGEPLFNEVSVSTVPWALGCIRSRGLAGLDMESFVGSVEALKAVLRDFRGMHPRPAASAPHDGPGPVAARPEALDAFAADDLLHLLEVFYEWAGFRPEQTAPGASVVTVRARTSRRGKAAGEPLPPSDEASRPNEDAPEEDPDEETAESDDPSITILNSFYAKDLERVIASLDGGEISPVLQAYLTPVPASERIDLSLPTGRERVLAALHPQRQNRGCWPGEPVHAMSLMQQFAVNSAFECLETGGLFSVNGPPGTGKTTLLRDIIAENITRRARLLSRLDNPHDAFAGQATVHFVGEREARISILRKEFTGFEMVVASSNNAAVENISKDLPKCGALGKTAWRDAAGNPRCTYLQPVAHALAARQPKGDYARLEGDDIPWGLVAGALGNTTNCGRFVKGVFKSPRACTPPPRGFDPERHKNIWKWRDGYAGPGFDAARQAFVRADERVSARMAMLAGYADVQAEFGGQTEANYQAEAVRVQEHARRLLADARAAVGVAKAECRACDTLLANLRDEEGLIRRGRPVWWQRLFNRPAHVRYGNELARNTSAQRDVLVRARAAQAGLEDRTRDERQVDAAFAEAEKAVADRAARWRRGQEDLHRLRREFPQAVPFARAQDLETDARQISGLWHDAELNGLRAELFAAAMQLHEAWLADVLRTGGGFGPNAIAVDHLLSGKCLEERRHAPLIWQSLFMIVPVISSTFASISRLFAGLDANSLGWVFMDEAGQAVPQAAVGALWRAKRAVVVGDPRQIEPVFTVPIKLLNAIAGSCTLPPEQEVAPHRVSAQNMADAANPLGAHTGSGWIGSPLRVHRRCAEPMFGLSNAIAYEGKMVYGCGDRRPARDSLDLGESAWVQLAGATGTRQLVPDQVALVHQALASLYARTGELPPVYVISPFKIVKQDIQARFSDINAWRNLRDMGDVPLPHKGKLRDWCTRNIGTVHTFQGKEASIVWMVLGCDGQTRGAAEWAGSRPNLLNVALTRARHRFFMVGDAGLWGGISHFSTAYDKLPVISPEEWLQRMRTAPPARTTACGVGDALALQLR